jgi:hypothetical protein
MQTKYKIKALTLALVIFLFSTVACNKLVEVDVPPTRITGDNVYNNDVTAIAVLNGLYAQISGNLYVNSTGFSSIGKLASLSADELLLWNGTSNTTFTAYYTNSLGATETFSAGSELWNICYSNIYICNSAIEGLVQSSSLTPAVKQQLLGEAKFMRAFFYFYLLNFYGDVPLTLSSDYTYNRLLSKSQPTEVYKQVILDLKEAQDLLSSNYLDISLVTTTLERIRPTKWAAAALLARAYLYNSEWSNAELQANTVISNSTLYDTVSLNNVFLKNSKEALWQLPPVNTSWNTEEARAYIIPSTGFSNSNPFSLSSNLLNAFEIGDKRALIGNWIKSITLSGTTYFYPYKYKSATNSAIVTEYLMMLRIAEQYLIRAEARAQQDKISGALEDLNVLRKRAGLSNSTASDKNTLLLAIYHERQVELFTEWGHRWLDLKRTNIDAVMSVVTPQKGGIWEPMDKLYPLPLGDIQKDPNLTQNPGY